MQNQPMPVTSNNQLSTVSIISAGVGWLCVPVWFCVGLAPLVGLCVAPLLAVIPAAWLTAIITGHIALGQIKRAQEGGRNYAILGLALGYAGMAMAVLALIGVAVILALSAANPIPNQQ